MKTEPVRIGWILDRDDKPALIRRRLSIGRELRRRGFRISLVGNKLDGRSEADLLVLFFSARPRFRTHAVEVLKSTPVVGIFDAPNIRITNSDWLSSDGASTERFVAMQSFYRAPESFGTNCEWGWLAALCCGVVVTEPSWRPVLQACCSGPVETIDLGGDIRRCADKLDSHLRLCLSVLPVIDGARKLARSLEGLNAQPGEPMLERLAGALQSMFSSEFQDRGQM